MVDGRGQVGRPEACGTAVGTQAVGLADHLASDHPAAGEDRRENRRPVVAAGHSARRQPRDPRRTAELAEHDHQRLVEQTADSRGRRAGPRPPDREEEGGCRAAGGSWRRGCPRSARSPSWPERSARPTSTAAARSTATGRTDVGHTDRQGEGLRGRASSAWPTFPLHSKASAASC